MEHFKYPKRILQVEDYRWMNFMMAFQSYFLMRRINSHLTSELHVSIPKMLYLFTYQPQSPSSTDYLEPSERTSLDPNGNSFLLRCRFLQFLSACIVFLSCHHAPLVLKSQVRGKSPLYYPKVERWQTKKNFQSGFKLFFFFCVAFDDSKWTDQFCVLACLGYSDMDTIFPDNIFCHLCFFYDSFRSS